MVQEKYSLLSKNPGEDYLFPDMAPGYSTALQSQAEHAQEVGTSFQSLQGVSQKFLTIPQNLPLSQPLAFLHILSLCGFRCLTLQMGGEAGGQASSCKEVINGIVLF